MKIRHLLAALALGVLPVSAAKAVNVSISVAPPPLAVYAQPDCPVEGYIWTPGYWAYDEGVSDYYWVQGVWVAPPRVGFLWTPGYWGYGGGFYAFHSGYWGPTVGFYGGINYGYGYGGYGYYGGRWDGRVFRYNTAVSRVNVNVVHNTYVDNNFHARTENRASFNGRGGIEAKADARERAAANSSHLRATAAQSSALKQARTARNPDPQAQRRTADRAQNQNRRVTPDGRTADARRDNRISRNSNTVTKNTRNTQRVARDTVTRGNRTARVRNSGGGRSRQRTVNSGGGRSRGPQPARQPQGGGGGNKSKNGRH